MEKIKVKISTNSPGRSPIRQTSGQLGVWGNCQFYFDDDINDCDWWVVYEGLKEKQTILCDSKRTILVTAESSHIKTYNPDFLRQFHTIVTTQRQIKASKIVHRWPQIWHLGMPYHKLRTHTDAYTKTYDELKVTKPNKTKLISIIASANASTKGHCERVAFVAALKEHFKERLDIFGAGVNHINDKWDGIAPYRYHIVIENSVEKDYWTEKLSDAFLAGAYPIYFGCPNIHAYFPEQTLTTIDIRKPAEAIVIIERVLRQDCYTTSQEALVAAKQLILNDYQFFPALHQIIHDTSKEVGTENKTFVTIEPEVQLQPNVLRRIIHALQTRSLKKTFFNHATQVLANRHFPIPHPKK
ncbi:MAG: glycosyltransferase family 10 [Candidatus Kaiserbacteria bacterium]|nr:glycosyltransferase family 10 [Candidatus Kaiserbacteria bacterium]